MNEQLPPLPVWEARSFWVSVLMLATVICNLMGLDLLAWAARVGLGSTRDQVADNVQLALPAVLAIWAWIERKAPKFRLIWGRVPK